LTPDRLTPLRDLRVLCGETLRHGRTGCRLLSSLAVVVLFAVAPARSAEPQEVVPLDGDHFSAELIAADADWNLTFRVGKDRRRIRADELVAWGAPREPKEMGQLTGLFPPAELLLADGGLLAADIRGSKGDRLLANNNFTQDDASTRVWGELSIPLPLVRGVLFSPPLDHARRDALANRLLEPGTKTDRLILHNGDVVAGRVQGFVQTAGEGDKQQFLVELAVEAATVKIAAERVAGSWSCGPWTPRRSKSPRSGWPGWPSPLPSAPPRRRRRGPS
jgi:hypothetical protein